MFISESHAGDKELGAGRCSQEAGGASERRKASQFRGNPQLPGRLGHTLPALILIG